MNRQATDGKILALLYLKKDLYPQYIRTYVYKEYMQLNNKKTA